MAEDKVGDGSTSSSDSDLSEQEKYERQQQHNSAVHHGGVAQLGDFDPEQQREEREEAEDGADNTWNQGDAALPQADPDDLPEDDEDDRPLDEISEKQGDVPANEGYPQA